MPVLRKGEPNVSENGNISGVIGAAAPEPKRMTIESIKKNKRELGEKIVLYGTEGWGKTTWAAYAPYPIFISTEDGLKSLPVGLVDVFDVPKIWQDIFDAVESLRTQDHQFKSLVLDTVDWTEQLCLNHILKITKCRSIVEVGGGYGKGFDMCFEEWKRLRPSLDALKNEKGMNIILLAHSMVKQFNSPDSENYDRWQMKCDWRIETYLREWADELLFGTYDIAVDTKNGRRGKGYGGDRIMYVNHAAAHNAKNRLHLTEPIPVGTDMKAAAESFWDIVNKFNSEGGTQ